MNVEALEPEPKPERYQEAIVKCRDYIAKNGMSWPQAAQESIYDVTMDRFLVIGYPTYILLDPDGKIVGLQTDVHNGKLDKTLEKLLAGRSPSAR